MTQSTQERTYDETLLLPLNPLNLDWARTWVRQFLHDHPEVQSGGVNPGQPYRRDVWPEFARSERFDGVWFLDLPQAAERQAIWRMFQQTYQIPSQPLPADEGWTGAEIRSCCRLAALLDVSLVSAAAHVVPVAVTAAESVQRLQSWASGRCLDATHGGIYQKETVARASSRKVNLPSSN